MLLSIFLTTICLVVKSVASGNVTILLPPVASTRITLSVAITTYVEADVLRKSSGKFSPLVIVTSLSDAPVELSEKSAQIENANDGDATGQTVKSGTTKIQHWSEPSRRRHWRFQFAADFSLNSTGASLKDVTITRGENFTTRFA